MLTLILYIYLVGKMVALNVFMMVLSLLKFYRVPCHQCLRHAPVAAGIFLILGTRMLSTTYAYVSPMSRPALPSMRVNFQGGERVRIVRIALRGGGGYAEQQDQEEWRPPAGEQDAAGMTRTRAALIKEHVSLDMCLNRPKEWRPPADAQDAVGMSLAFLRVCVRARRC